MSIERSFLPSFITEPLPNWRSIWESAADRALVLSMEDPSTIRRAVADMVTCSLWRGFASGTNGGTRLLGLNFRRVGFDFVQAPLYHLCSMFAICSFWRVRYWPA